MYFKPLRRSINQRKARHLKKGMALSNRFFSIAERSESNKHHGANTKSCELPPIQNKDQFALRRTCFEQHIGIDKK
jgi:hypothetical protein